VALGHPEDEVPGMPDETPAGLEEPLLEAGQGPAHEGTPARGRIKNPQINQF